MKELLFVSTHFCGLVIKENFATSKICPKMNMLFIKSGQLENVLNYDDYYMLLFERLSFYDS